MHLMMSSRHLPSLHSQKKRMGKHAYILGEEAGAWGLSGAEGWEDYIKNNKEKG